MAGPTGTANISPVTNGRRRGKPDADPKGRVAWISTRRAAPAADTIAGQLIGRYHLADVLASKDAPLTEMITADVVMIELPPVMKLRFEHQVLDMVAKLQVASLEILLMVFPCLRRKSSKSTWVLRWSLMTQAQFNFVQTCSCKLGNVIPGCHIAC